MLICFVFCLQILISGSHEGMDVDDLRKNAHYAGGYDEVSYV
jgi:ubiquitin-protein ligase E3 C